MTTTPINTSQTLGHHHGQSPMLRLHPAANVARAAYGTPITRSDSPTTGGVTQPARGSDSVARIGTHNVTFGVTPTSIPAQPTDHRDRLSGGSVSQLIDFDDHARTPATVQSSATDERNAPTGVYAMYRHPADKIAVATDLTASRAAASGTGASIDISG